MSRRGSRGGRRPPGKDTKKSDRSGTETPDAPDVSAAFKAVQGLTPRTERRRDRRGATQGAAVVVTTAQYSAQGNDSEVTDSTPSLAAAEQLTRSSYADSPEASAGDELRHKALSGEIYRDVSDFKSHTLMWVVGIVAATIIAFMTLTWTMNESLRDDVYGLMDNLRSDFRRETDRLGEEVEDLDARVDELGEMVPVETTR